MKPLPPPIFAPLSETEASVLGAYVHKDSDAIKAATGAAAVAWAMATQTLKHRGFLLLVDRGVLVTPEGLAAFLGEVGIEVDEAYWQLIRTASRAESAAAPDAATRPSRGRGRSAGQSSRRAPAAN